MKKSLIFLSLVALLASCTGVSVEKAKIKTAQDSVSYVLGAEYGSGMSQNLGTFPGGLNAETFLEAFVNGFEGDSADIIVDDLRAFYMEYVQAAEAADKDTTGAVFEPANKDSISYLIGHAEGEGTAMRMESFPGGMNMVAFLDAFVNCFQGDSARIKVENPQMYINDYVMKAQSAEAEKAAQEAEEAAKTDENALAGKAFLEENAKKDGVVTTASGLQYKVIKEGSGTKPSTADRVKVHYHGTLIDGSVFDSSVDRGEPISFAVTGVIPGWTEALQLMSVGSKYTLYIPYDLAYGARSTGSIPAYSALIFEVELLGINE